MNRQVKVIIGIAVLYGIGFGIYEFTLPLYLKDHGFNYRDMGWVYFFGALVQLGLAMYGTSLADWIGRKRVYVGGLLCGTSAYLLTPLTPMKWFQAGFKTLREAAQGIQANLQGVLVFENARGRFLQFFSRARGGEYACQAIGIFLAIRIIDAFASGYEPAFFGGAVLMMMATLLAILFLREPARTESRHERIRLTSLVKLDLHPKLYLIALSMFLFTLGLFISHSQYLLLFFQEKFACKDGTLATIGILHRATLGVPMLFAMWLVRRPRKAIYVTAVVLEGVFLSVSALVGNFYWATGVWLMHDIVGAALWVPIQQHLILKYARPECRAADVARVNAMGAIGLLFGPLIAGELVHYTGSLPAIFAGGPLDLPFFISGLVIILSALPLLFL